nr:galactokinase-like [Leptinotarsa decemlineata]
MILKKVSLRDANLEDIEYLRSINTDNNILSRARHIVTENKRTTDGAQMLKQMNYKKFGELMTESHYSLKNDYSVSCSELDTLVELALEVEGVLGSKMTGGGFGGCTVTLVYAHVAEKVIENITKKYKGNPTFYICKPSQGASIL